MKKVNLPKYNQRLLAILGTLAVITLAVIMVVGAVIFISDLIPRRLTPRTPSGIVIDQDQVVDTSAFSFSQEISILEPYQLDSASPVFIIPIGQKDQRTRRTSIRTGGLSFSGQAEDYIYSSFSGLYNNFVFIDYTRDIKRPVFDSKIALTEWAYMKVDSSQLILFKGTDKDVNKDGRLNDDDFQSLYVFDIATIEVKELRFENQTVREFEPLSMTSKIYVRTGIDLNGDKEFSYYNEPTDLYFYDVATGDSETLVPLDVKKEIQDILNQ